MSASATIATSMSATIATSNPSYKLNNNHSLCSKSYNHGIPNFNLNINSCCQRLHSYPFSTRNKLTIQAKRTSSNDSEESGAPGNESPSSGWKKWMVGLLFSIVLPSYRHKLGPLLTLKAKLDNAIEVVESVTEIVEDVAEETVKLADELEKRLPEDSELRDAVELMEDLARKAIKEADLAQELIQKVQDIGEEVEELLKSNAAKAKNNIDETNSKDKINQ